MCVCVCVGGVMQTGHSAGLGKDREMEGGRRRRGVGFLWAYDGQLNASSVKQPSNMFHMPDKRGGSVCVCVCVCVCVYTLQRGLIVY